MLESAVDGVRLWLDRFVNADGSVKVVERWGVTDGPDDIMETVRGWPLIYAMGAPESVIQAFEKVWEGHLRQFGRARLPGVELARDGIFVKEFPPAFDWEHIGEGLQAFYWYGLGRPGDPLSRTRARRFAGLYMNEDPAAPNYDPEHKIIKSLFNGSKGPVLRPVTPVDWDGDENPQRASRFRTSSNVRGDHPLNLLATTLATHAYLLTRDAKYEPSPVAFEALANLTLGAANLYGSGDVLRSQVRYFDPERRRAGLAQDVAALIERIDPDGVVLTIVNTSTVNTRRLIVQTGAYGEHQAVSVAAGGTTVMMEGPHFEVSLAPRAAEQLTLRMKRYVNDPTLAFPWESPSAPARKPIENERPRRAGLLGPSHVI
jgi:hypothetical protein